MGIGDRIRAGWAAVARIACSIAVNIRLIWVVGQRAVVQTVFDSVGVGVVVDTTSTRTSWAAHAVAGDSRTLVDFILIPIAVDVACGSTLARAGVVAGACGVARGARTRRVASDHAYIVDPACGAAGFATL